jgi:hypothetical protein
MPNSFRLLRAAVHEFVHRPLTEHVDLEALRDVMDELEGELDLLYESDPAAARAEALAEAKRFAAELRLNAKPN